MNEILLLDCEAAANRYKELTGVDLPQERFEIKYKTKPAGQTPSECSIIGARELYTQPVWAVNVDGEEKYLNAIGGDFNTDEMYFMQICTAYPGDNFEKDGVVVAVTRGWHNGKFGKFLLDYAVKSPTYKKYVGPAKKAA